MNLALVQQEDRFRRCGAKIASIWLSFTSMVEWVHRVQQTWPHFFENSWSIWKCRGATVPHHTLVVALCSAKLSGCGYHGRNEQGERRNQFGRSFFMYDLYQLIQLSRRRIEVSVFGAEALHKKTRPRANGVLLDFVLICSMMSMHQLINLWFCQKTFEILDRNMQKHVYRPWFQLSISTFKTYQEKWYSIH